MRIRSLILMVAATLLLCGCFRHQSKMVVNEDGSGSITETLVVDRGALEAGDVPLSAPLPRARDLALPSWVTVADYAAGNQEGLIINVSFGDPAQCNERVNALHRLLALQTGSMASSEVELTRQEDGWQFTMRTDNVASTPDLRPGGTDAALPDALYHAGELTLVVQLPGRVVDHNADQEINGELVWILSAQAVQSRFYARTHTGSAQARSPRDDRTLQLATAAATIGGLAVFAAVALSRKRDPLTAAAGAATRALDAASAGSSGAGPGPLPAGPQPGASSPYDVAASLASPGSNSLRQPPPAGAEAGFAEPVVLGDPANVQRPPLSSWPTTPPLAPPSAATPPHAGPPPRR